MLRELKGFISGGYFGISMLAIAAMADACRKQDKEIKELKMKLGTLSEEASS